MSRRISIVGPTASGKTSLSIEIAKMFGSDSVISCDSMAIYRHMDIGTAKPTVADLGALKCHLIDVADPDQEFSIAQFSKMAKDVESRSKEGSPVIFVGGSGLYHTSVFDHLEPPPTDPSIRAKYANLLDQRGVDWGYSLLQELDRSAAEKVEPQNHRRIARALEVIELTGRPFSSFGPGVDAYPLASGEIIGLFPGSHELELRIRSRNETLFQMGWIDECEFLLENFDLSVTASKAIGYREIFSLIKGELSLDQAKEEIVIRSRQYARRQMAWFRRDPRIKWFVGAEEALSYYSSEYKQG
ncbi:MAG: tRNA (adenosine(37)-N6)-dimethylallyltransferase MiaA [Actinomycetota bacterium]|nr:tRNA (adenosine(37)-N6)-dimethylallyltransferase MiaA [Actinomycetota bacterium]